MENESQQSIPKTNGTNYALIGIVALLIAGGLFYVFSARSDSTKMATTQTEMPSKATMPTQGKVKVAMSMDPVTPAPLTADQQKQLVLGAATDITQKTFTIVGGNFYYAPNKITVHKGDTVTLVFTNAGGFHNFNIDEYNIKSKNIATGESDTVTFTADKVGTFTYYCSIDHHRQKGQEGTLTVE